MILVLKHMFLKKNKLFQFYKKTLPKSKVSYIIIITKGRLGDYNV